MDLIKNIESLLNTPLDPTLFPLKKGNKIYIGKFYIKEFENSYKIYNNRRELKGTTQTKIAAIAMAKTLHKTNNLNLEIRRLDSLIVKNLQDSVFYKNLRKTTKDADRRTDADIKLSNASSKVLDAEDKLLSFIFPKEVNSCKVQNRKIT